MARSKPTHHHNSSSTCQEQFLAIPFVINSSTSIIFRLSRPRTWVFPVIGLILGYTSAGGGSALGLLIGVTAACMVTASTNLVNAYADRNEDVENQPSRALWLDKIGPAQALIVAASLFGIAEIVSITLGPTFMIILGVGIIDSLFYSLPPLRFKANPIRSLFAFSGAVGLSFLGGMSITGTINLLNPFLLLSTYFMFTYGTVKNLPDYQGDKKAGIKTSATVFPNISNAIVFSSLLLSTPYILLAGLVFARVVRVVYLLDLGLLMVLSLIIHQMWSTNTTAGLEKAHTVGFFYAISFLLFTLVLMSPTIFTLTVVLGAYSWALLVSKVNIDSRSETR